MNKDVCLLLIVCSIFSFASQSCSGIEVEVAGPCCGLVLVLVLYRRWCGCCYTHVCQCNQATVHRAMITATDTAFALTTSANVTRVSLGSGAPNVRGGGCLPCIDFV